MEQHSAIATYVDLASYVVNELKQVGAEVTLKQVDSVQWYGMLTRREFQLGINISGYGVDDPDAILFLNDYNLEILPAKERSRGRY